MPDPAEKASAALQAQAKDQAATLVQTAAQIDAEQKDSGERLTLGRINELIAPISISAAGLAELGFEPVATAKAAKLYRECDLPVIVAALVGHLQGVLETV